MFFQYLVQKWRTKVLTKVLSIFSTEVEDKGSDKGSSNV